MSACSFSCFWRNLCQTLTHVSKMSGKNSLCYINENGIAPIQLSLCVYSQPSPMAATWQPNRQSDKALSITSQTASKLCSQIRPYWIFCFISSLEKQHSATHLKEHSQAFIMWAALSFNLLLRASNNSHIPFHDFDPRCEHKQKIPLTCLCM